MMIRCVVVLLKNCCTFNVHLFFSWVVLGYFDFVMLLCVSRYTIKVV